MTRAAFLLLLPVAAFAAVDGMATNGTTGRPQPGLTVSLIEIGQAGMKPLAEATTGAQGRFHFTESPQASLLLQTTHQGVNYSATVQPGTSGVIQLQVFDVSKFPGQAAIAQHVFVFEPAEKEIAVSESFLFDNKGRITYYDPASGAVRVTVPDSAAESIQVTVTGPNNLPLQRSAGKTGKPNTYKVDFPIKPGESRIDVVYRLPFASPGKFSARPLQKAAVTRLVVPPGVELKGKGLEEAGVEPRSQARVFNVAAGPFEVEIAGAGSLRASEAPAEDEDSGPGIQQILPRLYDRAWVVIGITLAILALGFVMLYRRTPPPVPDPAPKGKLRK